MDFHLPELGEGVYEAELVSWHVQPGDVVKPGHPLMEVLTDKATMEVPAPFAGTIQTLAVEPGQKLKIGEVVLAYAPAGAIPPSPPTPQPVQAPSQPAPMVSKPVAGPALATGVPVKAAPSVRLMARKLGIDLAQMAGSGPGGRILIGDLTAQVHLPGKRETPAKLAEKQPDYGIPGTRLKLLGVRRIMADHMAKAAHTTAQATYVDECEVTDLVHMRHMLREPFAQQGVKLTYLPFFVKAIVAALREVPIVNATFAEAAGEIILHDHYHIGVATATPAGLLVPVVHDADKKSLLELARAIERLTNEARAGTIRLEELRSGTFTLTSIGSLGGLFAAPIINLPEAAILAIGKIVKRPVFDEHNQVRPADMVYVSLTFDHRFIDGATATAFGNAVMKWLRQPGALVVGE